MNTWELMQLQRSNPGLLGLTQQDFAFAPDDPAWQAHRQRDTYQGLTPQQILATYAAAPGRLGQLFQGIASGAQPKDRAFMGSMYSILQSVTPEERAWVQQHPDWMQAYGKLEGAGYIKDTKSEGMGNVVNTFADKVLLPLTKMVVMGAVGAGIGGAVGYGAGATSGQGLFGLGPELGLSGPWGGEALTGAQGLGAMGGGEVLGGAPSTLQSLGQGGLFDASLANIPASSMVVGNPGVMGSMSALGSMGLPEAMGGGALTALGVPGGGAAPAGDSMLDKLASLPGRAFDKALDNPLGTVATLGGLAGLVGSRGGSIDTSYSDAAGGIASDLYRDTAPVRASYLSQVGSDLNRYADPASVYSTPAYGAAKYFSERAYNQARNSTMGSVPRGGVLQSKLSDLDTARAGSMTSTLADLWDRQRELSLQRASTAALGTPSTSIAGLTQAGQTSALAQGQAMQSDAALGAGIGNLAGQVAKASWMRPNK